MKAHLNIIFTAAMLCLLTACRRDMFSQPKSNPLSKSDFFEDGAASRPLPPHVIARDNFNNDATFYTGMVGTNPATEFPYPITRASLERGRICFEINCVPCHGEAGEGNGIVVQRGFPTPPSYHIARLRNAPVGHFFDVMTHGYGAMYSFASRTTPQERWDIAAYIRALQLSEHATLADVPTNEVAQLESMK
ncbi:MAG TPA: cytochrome c [Pseudomonadales bacterium]|nr:cytochrome c [Pseudomonadales bacterium]